MTAIMAKQKKPGRPKGRKETVSLQLRVPPALAAALDRLLTRTRRTRNQEAILALEKYLEAEGEWPPPAATSNKGDEGGKPKGGA